MIIYMVMLSQETHEWKLVKDNNNIKAYVKKQDNSKIKKVKVETIFRSTLSELVSIITDAKNHKDWVFMNDSACIVDTLNQYSWTYYGYSDLPWPVSDRDFITCSRLVQDSIDYSVTITSFGKPELLPEIEDCVRLKTIYSVWKLNPLGNGEVHMSYELSVDIGGKMPIWLINLAVTKGPLSTVEGLMEQIECGKYKNISQKHILEL